MAGAIKNNVNVKTSAYNLNPRISRRGRSVVRSIKPKELKGFCHRSKLRYATIFSNYFQIILGSKNLAPIISGSIIGHCL